MAKIVKAEYTIATPGQETHMLLVYRGCVVTTTGERIDNFEAGGSLDATVDDWFDEIDFSGEEDLAHVAPIADVTDRDSAAEKVGICPTGEDIIDQDALDRARWNLASPVETAARRGEISGRYAADLTDLIGTASPHCIQAAVEIPTGPGAQRSPQAIATAILRTQIIRTAQCLEELRPELAAEVGDAVATASPEQIEAAWTARNVAAAQRRFGVSMDVEAVVRAYQVALTS